MSTDTLGDLLRTIKSRMGSCTHAPGTDLLVDAAVSLHEAARLQAKLPGLGEVAERIEALRADFKEHADCSIRDLQHHYKHISDNRAWIDNAKADQPSLTKDLLDLGGRIAALEGQVLSSLEITTFRERLDKLERWRLGATSSIQNLETYADEINAGCKTLEAALYTRIGALESTQIKVPAPLPPEQPTPEPAAWIPKVDDKVWVSDSGAEPGRFPVGLMLAVTEVQEGERLDVLLVVVAEWCWIDSSAMRCPDTAGSPIFTRAPPVAE